MGPGWWQPSLAPPSAPPDCREALQQVVQAHHPGQGEGTGPAARLYCDLKHTPKCPLGSGRSALERTGGGCLHPAPFSKQQPLGRKRTGTLRSPLPMRSGERPQLAGAEVGAAGISTSRTVS